MYLRYLFVIQELLTRRSDTIFICPFLDIVMLVAQSGKKKNKSAHAYQWICILKGTISLNSFENMDLQYEHAHFFC